MLFCAGYVWMLSLPSPRLGRGTYIDENALQPAQACCLEIHCNQINTLQVNTYWNWKEVHNADRYLDQLERLRDANATSEQ